MNMKQLKEIMYLYLKNHPPALELFYILEKAGDVYLIGGVLREYKDNNAILNLRDVDIIIDVQNIEYWEKILSEFEVRKNRFGGYKLCCSGLIVDIWPLDETWAYKKQIVKCSPAEYVESLIYTVFLNIDAIVYDMKRDIWYDGGYKEAMRTRVLDVVLECNPEIHLNIVRAMVLKERYKMTYSKKLKEIIVKEREKSREFSGLLMDIQFARYKKEILSKETIEKELMQI